MKRNFKVLLQLLTKISIIFSSGCRYGQTLINKNKFLQIITLKLSSERFNWRLRKKPWQSKEKTPFSRYLSFLDFY